MKHAIQRTTSLPDITSFADYREFLLMVMEHKRVESKKYSYDYWAKKLGTSRSYLKLLTSKRRHASQDRLWKIAKIFNLSPAEKQYLLFLFQMNTAVDPEVRMYFRDILLSLENRFRVFARINVPLPESNSAQTAENSLHSWLHMTLSAMVRLHDFRDDFNWMQERLGGKVELTEIEKAWSDLLEAGILVKTPRGYQNRTAGSFFDSPIGEPWNHSTVRPVLRKAYEVCGDTTEHRSFTFQTMNLVLSKQEGIRLVDMYQEFLLRVQELERSSTNPEYVFLVANCFFNVTPRREV